MPVLCWLNKMLKYILFFCLLYQTGCTVSVYKLGDNRTYKYVNMNKEMIEFDDGDTVFYGDTTIRILGIDTPEIIHEEHGIYKNQEFGPEAAEFTKNELLKATTIQYVPYKKDRYKRLLAHVFVDGELLAVKLIKAGLAYETVSFYGDNKFPEFANEILEAAKDSPKPKFVNPIFWRRKNQNKSADLP